MSVWGPRLRRASVATARPISNLSGRTTRPPRDRIDTGTVWVNRYGRPGDFILPTGGESSGIGRDLGRQAFEAAQLVKTALISFEESAPG
jgi:acyl-CoA reductase-like NAD-dependent aldehyde dehydrogenase